MRLISLRAAVDTKDPSFDNFEALSWSIMELNLAIICHNLPVLRIIVVRTYPDLDPRSADAASEYRPTRQELTTQSGSRAGSGGSGGDSTEVMKTVARCFSGRFDGESQVALMEKEHGMGHILVTTDTMVESSEAPARGTRPPTSSWEERTLGGED